MKGKKGILSMIFAIATTALVSATVFAAPVGYSDYGTTEKKSVAEATSGVVALTETKTGVSLDVPTSALPAGVTAISLEVQQIDTSTPTYVNAVSTAANSGYANAVVFDFTMRDQNGNPVTNFNSDVTITVPAQGDVNTIVYYDDVNNQVVPLETEVVNGFLVAKLKHFSYYMMVKADKTATNVPATGDYGMTIIIICGAVAVLALGGAFLAVKAKKARQ